MKSGKFSLIVCFCFVVNSMSLAQQKNIDPSTFDASIKPGDNFYLYVNGKWLANNPVPPSKTAWGSAYELVEQSSKALKELLEEASKNSVSNKNAKRVGDYYFSAMDSAGIEKKGYQPIKSYLDKINTLKNKTEVVQQIAWLRNSSIASPYITPGVRQDSKNVERYIVGIGQGGTTLPDRDFYLKDDPRSKKIREAFLAYMQQMFALTGEPEARAKSYADDILKMETMLAKAQLSRVEMRDPVKLYNMLSINRIREIAPNLSTPGFFKELGYKKVPDSIVVTSPSFLAAADSILNITSLDTWKAYLKWNVIRSNAAYLSSDFVNANFTFNQVLSGQKEQAPRWQRMNGLVDRHLGDLVSQLYVQKHFKPEAKQRMRELVRNLQETFGERIQKLDWMSDETRARAMQKLNTYANKIGYPDKWKDYPGLEINRNDLVTNVRNASAWHYRDMISRLGKPIDKTEWGMTASTVNAYYSPQRNEVVFPAAILRPPFFDPKADDAINYGGIVAVIGHEISHGFDDQGRQYDHQGNLKDWWSPSDASLFKQKADAVEKQYAAYTVLDSIHVNGKLTLGENIADIAGLSVAYAAFKKTEQGKSGKLIDGLTPDQRFFINWAQIWRTNMLPETMAQRIITDNHSPAMHRANGPLTNLDAWYEAFNIKETDKMYKAPADRIRIW